MVCRPHNVTFRGFLECDTISGSIRCGVGGDCAEQLSSLSRMMGFKIIWKETVLDNIR